MTAKPTKIRCSDPSVHSRGRFFFKCCRCKETCCAFCIPYVSNTMNKRILCEPCWHEREAQETGAAPPSKDVEIERLTRRLDEGLAWLDLSLKHGTWGSVEDAYSALHPDGLVKHRSFNQCFNCPTPGRPKAVKAPEVSSVVTSNKRPRRDSYKSANAANRKQLEERRATLKAKEKR